MTRLVLGGAFVALLLAAYVIGQIKGVEGSREVLPVIAMGLGALLGSGRR